MVSHNEVLCLWCSALFSLPAYFYERPVHFFLCAMYVFLSLQSRGPFFQDLLVVISTVQCK